MSRADLWAALGEAGDAIQAAVDAHEREATPQTRAAVKAAFEEYVQRLTPVIGTAETFKYEAA